MHDYVSFAQPGLTDPRLDDINQFYVKIGQLHTKFRLDSIFTAYENSTVLSIWSNNSLFFFSTRFTAAENLITARFVHWSVHSWYLRNIFPRDKNRTRVPSSKNGNVEVSSRYFRSFFSPALAPAILSLIRLSNCIAVDSRERSKFIIQSLLFISPQAIKFAFQIRASLKRYVNPSSLSLSLVSAIVFSPKTFNARFQNAVAYNHTMNPRLTL